MECRYSEVWWMEIGKWVVLVGSALDGWWPRSAQVVAGVGSVGMSGLEVTHYN